MEPVKLASGIGGHGPQILYTGGRQPPPGHPPGTQVVHPPTTRSHEGSPYKGTISPPMVSRGGPYPSYASVVDGGHGGAGPRYIQQPTYLTYQRDSHYARSMADRPLLMPQAPKRPSIMGGYSGYPSRGDMMQMISSTLPVSVSQVDSCKRIKLSQPPKTDVRFPLVIDTDTNHSSRESSYYPQVEAISPTLPPDPRDESPLHSTKDDLIKQIEQVDKDIALTDASVTNLRKKEKELESAAAASKGDTAVQPEAEENKDARHQSTAQIIYAENRKIAEEGHNSLAKLIPPLETPRVLPLYHQPSDTEIYHQNKAKYSSFKQRLLDYFKKKQEAKYNRELQITQTYTKLMNEWVKKVDKIENSKKHKEKVGKNRELFEKVFPELRKQREDKERFSRVGARVKSDAEMEEIIDGIQDQENEDKKMRAYAVIPPILLDDKRRSYRYSNRNGLVEDALGEHKERKNVNLWTEQECEVFKDKYLQHPKNFVVISSYLERKSVSDCIQNYYLTKKKENYKLLVKRRMRRPRNKGNNQPQVDSLLPINSTGVTTRGSAAAAQKEMMKNGNSVSASSSMIPTSSSPSMMDDNGMTVNGAITMTSHAPSTVNWSSSSSNDGQTVSMTVSMAGSDVDSSVPVNALNPPVPSSAPTASSPAGADESTATFPSACSTSSNSTSTNVVVDSVSVMSNCQEVREKDKENLTMMSDKVGRRDRNKSDDSSDEENLAEHGRGVPHDCVLCKTRLEHYGQSRPVSCSQASQYGLSESLLPPNARVCSNCRCRTVKRRVPQCLIPTCSTAKWRVKRLRPFPSRWNHLPASLKDPIIKELKIPSDVTKSCSACHNRIIRKLGSDAEEPLDTSRWSEEDIENLRSALREVGCHWSKVTEKVKNKTQGQCKSFYFNLKSKYKLDEALSEYRKAKGKTDPPTVTDEEESGSSTSSGDEAGSLPPPHLHPPPQVRHDSASDTASASSPPPTINNVDDRKDVGNRDSIIKEPPPPAGAKEDNDSSATASADEGQNGMGRDSPPEVQHIPHPGERRPSSQPVMGGVGKCLTPGRNLLPPPQTPVVAGVAPNAPNFKQIIDNTIEETIAKSAKDNRGYHPETKIPVANDHITITTLLDSSYSQKNAGRAQGGWNYPPVSHQQNVIDQRAIPERHTTPTPYDMDCCEGGLDLTVKKRDRSSPQPPSHPVQQHPQSSAGSGPPREIPTMTMRGGAEVIATGKGSPPRAHSNSISYSQTLPADRYLQDYRKSPSNFSTDSRGNLAPPTPPTIASIVTRVPSPHMVYGSQPPRQPVPLPKTTKSSMAPPPPMIVSSPRVSHAHMPSVPSSSGARGLPLKPEKSPISMHGSITHGTPVNQHTLAPVSLSQANRYEMIAKPIMTREGGSITQGTPVHHDGKRGAPPPSNSTSVKDTLMVEPRSGVEIIPRPSPVPYDREIQYRPQRPPITSSSSYSYPTYAYTRPSYSDSQISSRQIIETDYLTSQQMAGRRGAPMEKEIRISPRSREQGPPPPPPSQRDQRGYPPPPPQAAAMDRRALEQHARGLEARQVDHRIDQRPDPNLEFRPVDVRSLAEGGDKVRKIEYFRTAHGYVPIHSQSSGGASHYITTSNVRVSRPSASPASVRDATPTPPTSETTLSPHDFRSPGVSTPTPPSRVNSVIQRQPTSKPHMPSKGGSPRPDGDRYSPHHPPRHLTVIPSMGGESINIADMLQRPGAYANMDIRREARPAIGSPHHSVPQHERHQLEGIGKQMVETLQNSRYISDVQGNEREKEIHTVEIRPSVDDRRYYDRLEYNRVRIKEDFRNMASGKILTKESEENNSPGNIILNFQMDPSKSSASPKNRGGESLTAANLIEAIITNHINQGHVEEVGRGDPRSYRREGEPSSSHSHNTPESDKRVRSPATVSSYHSSKDKEIVTVEDGTDLSAQSRHSVHKDGLATLHVAMPHHPNYSKNNPGHMEQMNREYANAEGKKKTSASHHYSRPPLEITRTDGRAVTHLNLYDHSNIRSSSSVSQGHHPNEKESHKEQFDARSSHRMSPSTSSGVHVHSTSHLATDERQIIRIVQPQTNPFDLIKNKLKEIWREGTPDNGSTSDRRMPPDGSGGRHSRSATPINQQQQQPQQRQQPTHQGSTQASQQQHPPTSRSNAQYEDESAKKRPRLDLSDSGGQRPPSRPRSTGGGGNELKEEVADSPQSGEMVIDETPRDGKLGGEGQHQDKLPSRATVNQYSNSYPGYRGGGNQPVPPHGGNWGVNAPPLPAPTNLSGSRPQGYEPNVEPVSDDD